MSDDCEYVSNPRLRVLAEELRILNDILVKKNLPDRIRLFQLRDFAQASKQITGISLPTLTLIGEDIGEPHWTTKIDGKSIGAFSTPTKAIEAYKRAHVERFGLDSQYHPDRPIDESHLYEDGELPTGVRITSEGRYMALIGINGRQTCLGTFDTADDAHEAYLQAKARQLPPGVQQATSGKFRARLNQEHLGTFETPDEASDAYQHAKELTTQQRNAANARAARSAKTAAARQARAERYGNVTLPTGVRMASSGLFNARIKTGKGGNKVETHLGTFNTPEEAHHAYKRAHVEYYGKASPYHEEMRQAA